MSFRSPDVATAARCTAVSFFGRCLSRCSAVALELLPLVAGLALASPSAWAADKVDLVRVDKSERRNFENRIAALQTKSDQLGAEKGLIERMEVRPGYLDVMRLATSSQRA